MKNLITAIFLLFSLTNHSQDWQLDGTKYPNATNQGDTVSLATKVPLWDADNLQNYFADLGDILALNPAPDLSNYVDRTTNQEVFGQKTWQDINTFNGGVTIFNGRILSDYMGLRPLTTLPSSNDTGRFGYLSSGYFAFKPIDKPTAYLDFTNLTSNEYFDFPDKSGTIALLDDIPEPIQETGDFVPTLSTFAGGTITSFTNLESYYSRLGDQVTVVVHLAQINSSGDVGYLVIGNLPFPFKTGYLRGSTGSARVYPESGVTVVSTCYNQGSEIYVLRNNDNSSTVYDMPFVNGQATITLTYITD